MKNRYIVIIIGMFLCGSLLAQTAVQADAFFVEKQFDKAQSAYANLLKRSPKNVLYLYRYARCAQELGQDSIAIDYFLRSGEKYALRNFYLAELYAKHYYFEQALTHYAAYLKTIEPTIDSKPNERYTYVQKQMTYAEKGARYLRRVTDVTIVDSVILPKTTFLSAYHLSVENGSLTDSLGGVVYTNQRNDRRILTDSVDDRLGLLSCQRLLDGWSACDTLRLDVGGNINYPFVLSDGLTLYFAADDAAGLGGYDIYYTRYNASQNVYLAPENVGFPFNSSGNDYMLAIDELQHKGYFATDRFTGDSLVAVYTFVPNAETKVLRNVDSTYLRAAAQLKAYRVETIDTVSLPSHTHTITLQSDSHFVFIVNDSIICRTLADFVSVEAQQALSEYLQLEADINDVEMALLQTRATYTEANEQQRVGLAKQILTNEMRLPTLISDLQTLAVQIRRFELQARGLL